METFQLFKYSMSMSYLPHRYQLPKEPCQALKWVVFVMCSFNIVQPNKCSELVKRNNTLFNPEWVYQPKICATSYSCSLFQFRKDLSLMLLFFFGIYYCRNLLFMPVFFKKHLKIIVFEATWTTPLPKTAIFPYF